ncbi:MAG: glycosyltransferase, partial [Myxococcales bacterium]|nr:glycosyltransferase [Myxococcales bacterium]
PPLLNTVRVSAARGIRSVVVASVPLAARDAVPTPEVVAPARVRGGAAQLTFLAAAGARLVRSFRPDLVVGHNMRGLGVASLLPTRAPLVYHCHDFEHANAWIPRVEWAASLRATEVWVPAEERRDRAAALGLRAPVRVVENCPVRMGELPAPGRLRRWLASEGVPNADTVPIVLRHGGIGRSQCILETVETLPQLPRGTVFVVVGEGGGAYRERCIARAAELGVGDRLRFHPFVSHGELWELLVDATVGMTLYAPTGPNAAAPAPNKVYECMAAGVPVVVTHGNSIARMVEASGAGLSVPVDVARLTDALRTFIVDDALRKLMGSAAREAHLARYHYESELAPTIFGALSASTAS